MLVETEEFDEGEDGCKGAICYVDYNTSCEVKKRPDGSLDVVLNFLKLNDEKTEKVLEAYAKTCNLNIETIMEEKGKFNSFKIPLYAESTSLLTKLFSKIGLNLPFITKKDFEEGKRRIANMIRAINSNKPGIKLDSAVDFFKGLEDKDLADGKSKGFYNSSEFFEYKLDCPPVLIHKRGIINPDSLYCSLMTEELAMDGNNLTKITNPAYKKGFPPELIIEILAEAQLYHNRGLCFYKEGEREELGLEGIIENNKNAYIDYERSLRIIRYTYANTFRDMKTVDGFTAAAVLRAYVDLLAKRAYALSTVQEASIDFEAAKRTLDYAFNKINKLSLVADELIQIFIVDDEPEFNGGYSDGYEFLESPEPWQAKKKQDQKEVTPRRENENPYLGDELDSFYSFVDVIQNEILNEKSSIERREERAYLEDLELMPSEFSIDEIPVMRRVKHLCKNGEKYEECIPYRELYNEIIRNQDFLGFKVKGSFMFE